MRRVDVANPSTATMQTSHHLHTLLLLFLAATVPLRSNAEDLVDVDGDAVLPNTEYYMVSSIRGAGGGGVLPVENPGVSSCASYVGWAALDLDRGVPVILELANSSNAEPIAVNEGLYIRFSEVDSCVETPYWTLSEDNEFVTTGGTGPVDAFDVGPLSLRTGSGGLSNAYSLVFCPCPQCALPCLEAVRSSVNGQRILGAGHVSESDFNVFLIKAEGSTSTRRFPSLLLRTRAESGN